MGQITISVTKRCAFRDSVQHFSNVYTYRNAGINPGISEANELMNEVVTFEKSLHSSQVTFVKARCWSSGGSITQNQMISELNLTGTGTGASMSGIDRERAYLVMWRAGVDSRGRPVFLRKWYHTCGGFGVYPGPAAANIEGTSGFSQAQRDTMAGIADAITRIGELEGWGLTAESGRERDGGPPTVHKYLEHHQLGDEWRG